MAKIDIGKLLIAILYLYFQDCKQVKIYTNMVITFLSSFLRVLNNKTCNKTTNSPRYSFVSKELNAGLPVNIEKYWYIVSNQSLTKTMSW